MAGKVKGFIKLSEVPSLILEITGVTRGKNTVYVWVKHGRLTTDGRLLKLKAKKRFNAYYTTREWVEEFIGQMD